MRRSPVSAYLLSGVIVACAAGSTRAAVLVTSLDTLVPGGASSWGLLLGGERFSQFAFRNTGPYNVSTADVTVRVSNEASPGNLGRTDIQFAFGTDAAAGQASDVFIDYRIDEQDNTPLNRAGLRFNGPVPSQGIGPGAATVMETVSTVDGSDLTPVPPISATATLDVFNDGPGRVDDSNSDFLALNYTFALRVSNQITLYARETGRLDVSVMNTFSTIPEPTAGFIALPAALSLLTRRWPHGQSCPLAAA
jgi:hypothetical protein